MCGIYGFAGNFPNPNLLMRSLVIANIPRGEDSFGIFTSTGQVPSDFKQAKSLSRPTDWICNDRFNELTTDSKANVMVGHNRFATIGKVSLANAHPFEVGDTIGVHNGTVANLETVRKATGKRYAVDSKHLIHLLDRNGNVGPAYGKINLAYCQRKDAANLRLIRHGHPLYYATPHDGKGWFAFSSLEEHLETALAICGFEYGTDYNTDWMEDNTSLAVYLGPDNQINDIQRADEKVRHWETPVKKTGKKTKNYWTRYEYDLDHRKDDLDPLEKMDFEGKDDDYYINELYSMDEGTDLTF